MTRTVTWLTLGAVVVTAVAVTRPSATTRGAAHTVLHLNCPPDSHGPARSDGVGRGLKDARESARNSRPVQ